MAAYPDPSMETVSQPDCPPRRQLLKIGGVTVASAFAPTVSKAQIVPVRPPSPPTSLWAQPLPVQRPISPESGLSPSWSLAAGGKECGRADHQAIARFPPQEVYRVEARVGRHS